MRFQTLPHARADVIRLRVPGSLRYRDLAIRVVAASCKLCGDGKDGQFDTCVVSAFGEAFNNVAIHSYRGRAAGDLEIEIEVFTDRITIRLLDFGATFDPLALPEPDLDSLPESGLGVYIMRSFMDDVSYEAGTPNVLTMTKYLNPNSRQLEQPGD